MWQQSPTYGRIIFSDHFVKTVMFEGGASLKLVPFWEFFPEQKPIFSNFQNKKFQCNFLSHVQTNIPAMLRCVRKFLCGTCLQFCGKYRLFHVQHCLFDYFAILPLNLFIQLYAPLTKTTTFVVLGEARP